MHTPRSLLALSIASVVLLTACTSSAAVETSAAGASSTSLEGGSSDAIVNEWVAPPVDPTALPIGTSSVSTTAPAVGGLFACDPGDPNGPGAFAVGPWIDEAAGTWNAEAKLAVQGEVSWPMASYDEDVEGDVRSIASSGVPVGAVTGEFPIAADDPAYDYDRNPNSIGEHDLSIELPVSPSTTTASCLSKGPIGILRNGVVLFASIDEQNRDAVAYETQDQCDGHPERSSTYHYHSIPSCVLDAATGPSTVVGWAADGFPIVVERDVDGNLPTNADLDECHGRTSPIALDGEIVESYHYSATAEFPYFVGCFRGTPHDL